MYVTIGRDPIDGVIDRNHLAIELSESPESEVAVALRLRDLRDAVVVAVQQRDYRHVLPQDREGRI